MPKKTNTKEKDDDFKYIVRIGNTNIDGNKTVVHGLTSIKGVGGRVAETILKKTNFPKNKKIGELDDESIDKLKEIIEKNITTELPVWMLNARNDYVSGDDLHYIGVDLNLKNQDDVQRLKKIKCYRGYRHAVGKKVRGQKTRSNGRRGLAVGVSRKRPGK